MHLGLSLMLFSAAQQSDRSAHLPGGGGISCGSACGGEARGGGEARFQSDGVRRSFANQNVTSRRQMTTPTWL